MLFYYGMAYSGEWLNYFLYIARQLKEQSTVREFMEGESLNRDLSRQ